MRSCFVFTCELHVFVTAKSLSWIDFSSVVYLKEANATKNPIGARAHLFLWQLQCGCFQIKLIVHRRRRRLCIVVNSKKLNPSFTGFLVCVFVSVCYSAFRPSLLSTCVYVRSPVVCERIKILQFLTFVRRFLRVLMLSWNILWDWIGWFPCLCVFVSEPFGAMDTGACCVAPSAPTRSDDQIVPAHPGDCWNLHTNTHSQPFVDAWLLQMQVNVL